jgi:AraC family transcriptional regulator
MSLGKGDGCMNENNYSQIVNQAINYIHFNVDKSITAEDIANHCCFSKYYFNRIFRSIVNESVYSFIKRMKLENAAFKLRTNKRKAITEIALEAGYSPSNFAVAFKEYFGISASDFRKNSTITPKDTYKATVEHISRMEKQEDFFDQIASKITIRQLLPMLLEYERFIGNYYDLAKAWGDFCSYAEKRHLIKEGTLFIGISYDDPLVTDEDNCMYDMCVTVDAAKGTNVHKLESGLYACYDFYDRLENLNKAFNEIFSLWLPYSNFNIDNRLPLEVYKSPLDEEGRMHIDICIPVV